MAQPDEVKTPRARSAGAADRSPGGARAKVLTLPDLARLRQAARIEGRTVVQCHGCFDIVHPGHIRHLRQAKSHGDILLVSITGDEAWTKRDGAPLIPQELRAENLAELDCVDWVYIEPAPTAAGLLAAVTPDVYVKGKEYERNQDPRFAEERRIVERAGGRVVFSSGDVVFSSTALITSLERTVDPYHTQLTHLLARPELDHGLLLRSVNAFQGRPVLVIGETILDTYWLCDQPEVATESPVLTLRPLEKRQYDGGAAVIARHLSAMGARPTLLTTLPDNTEARLLCRRLEAEGVRIASVASDQAIPEKQRFLVGAQKVMKLNNYKPCTMDAERRDELVALAADLAHGQDAAIVVDFGNGMLSPVAIERLSAELRPRVGTLAGDVSGRRAALKHFRNFDLLAPSEQEARAAMQCFDESLPVVAWRLFQETGARHAMITLGPDGLVACSRRHRAAADESGHASRVTSEHVPSLVTHALDPLGCGDALLSAATLALASGAPPVAAAFLGTLAAAAEAQRLGNVPTSAADLRSGLARLQSARLVCAPQGAALTAPERLAS
ncbi:MAG: PfkB family carbohydrate kinase [Phycisphaerales bacterium]